MVLKQLELKELIRSGYFPDLMGRPIHQVICTRRTFPGLMLVFKIILRQQYPELWECMKIRFTLDEVNRYARTSITYNTFKVFGFRCNYGQDFSEIKITGWNHDYMRFSDLLKLIVDAILIQKIDFQNYEYIVEEGICLREKKLSLNGGNSTD